MNQCTGANMNGCIFTHSECQRYMNLQAVRVWCYNPNEGVLVHVYQACNNNEICVDTGLPMFTKAYCRSTENYIKIAGKLAGKTFGKIQIPANEVGGRRVSTAEAIVAGDDRATALQSQSITIRALHQQFTYSPTFPLL